MTPGARWQAVIDLYADVTAGGTADGAASAYFRARRYIGSKDRAFIADRLFAALRRRARLSWRVDRVLERFEGGPPPVARHVVIADMVTAERWTLPDFERGFDGGQYRPEPLSRNERRLVEALAGQPLDHADQPDWVRFEYPLWLESRLRPLFAADESLAAALIRAAPLDLRVNRLVATRDAALSALKHAGIAAEAAALSPVGIRVAGRPALAQLPLFKSGAVEIQDEGSQLVALMVDARPGQIVMDYCAGAGGKTLAIADAMGNRGRLVASDSSASRLDRAVKRLRRAGVHNVERRAIDPENATWFRRQAGRFDRVLVDAPCSGTGTWRRNPDMKWKIGPDDLAELVALQRAILERAAKLAKPGGRLIYATCSLLAEENEEIAAAFLDGHAEFALLPIAQVWPAAIGGAPPTDGPMLRLSPGRHHTDGFFAAIFERRMTPLQETDTPGEPQPP